MEIIPILAPNKIHNKLSYAQGKRKTIRWVPLGGECWSILGWLLGMVIPPWHVWMSKNEALWDLGHPVSYNQAPKQL